MIASVCLFAVAACVRYHTYLITSDGVHLAYRYQEVPEARGSVVLLHGLGSDYSAWDFLKGFFNRHRWSTMAMDFRGHGDSIEWKGKDLDWKAFSHEGFRTMLRDIDAAVQHLNSKDNVWLVGASMGANLALEYAKDHPGIHGLVLMS
ncbi:MAG: lysophospholipase, partial [Candidatus Omnitrophica bacterium]|nr:lysophospholipase [Candidatus Omnitrophota bacterium]